MKISVVIPCRNEAQYIEECIDAIYNCDLPEKTQMQVFVVDGMSNDGTREIVEEIKSRFIGLELVDNSKQLTPFAFNIGIKAGGIVDFVQIIGARHIVSKNYILECIGKLQADNSVWCIGGKIINEFNSEEGELISKAMSTSFGMGIGNFRTLDKSGFTDTVTSPMYPYWVFEKIGFFDEDLVRNQDDDFNYRVTKAGGKIYFLNEIELRYYVRSTVQGLKRQFFQYGYWKVFVNKKHKAVTTLRQMIPPLFCLYLFVFPFLFLLHWKIGAIAAMPFILYIFLSIYESIKLSNSSKTFFQSLIIYPTLHVSYGLGYLKGIIQFLLLNQQPSKKESRLSR